MPESPDTAAKQSLGDTESGAINPYAAPQSDVTKEGNALDPAPETSLMVYGAIIGALHSFTCLVPITLLWPEDVLWIMTFGQVRLNNYGPWGDPIRIGMALLFVASFVLLLVLLLGRRCRAKWFYWGAMGAAMNMGFWVAFTFFYYLPFMVIIWWCFGRRYREFYPRDRQSSKSD